MKKLLTTGVLSVGLLISLSVYTPTKSDIEDPGGARYCRCKHGGCNAGNKISFRPICAVNTGNCSAWDLNC